MAKTSMKLESFQDPAVTEAHVAARLSWLRDVIGPRLERYLGYYRNLSTELSSAVGCGSSAGFLVRPFRQYQEAGLPARITGFRGAADGSCSATGTMDEQRKEVVIENDIAWRMDTLVDFVTGRLPGITSTSPHMALRKRLNPVIDALLGGPCGCTRLMQQLVLQGCIYGSAWVHMRPTPRLLRALAGTTGEAESGPWVELELLPARQVMPLGGCVVILREDERPVERRPGLMERMRAWLGGAVAESSPEEFSFDVIGPSRWQRYDKGVLVEEGANPLGFVPLVRYENAGDPAAGTRVGAPGSVALDVGMGDVEPLMALQDELNTRLSDRAHRVTMTSFQMYLGKGIEDFIRRPIGPGQMWASNNPDAQIEAFGGDRAAPGEEAHINEIREAMDKISGVSPVAAGQIRGKLGNLTSAVALRVTLIALLARTERKRAAVTQTLRQIVRHGLRMLDLAGVERTSEADREVDVNWLSALPESQMDRIAEAQAKLALGVPRNVVLTELGYGELTTEGAPETANAATTAAAEPQAKTEESPTAD